MTVILTQKFHFKAKFFLKLKDCEIDPKWPSSLHKVEALLEEFKGWKDINLEAAVPATQGTQTCQNWTQVEWSFSEERQGRMSSNI